MMLNEQRKEALLENADKLHSGQSLSSPQLKRTRLGVVWLNLAVLGAVVLVFIGVTGG
jgi:hypothetical protein